MRPIMQEYILKNTKKLTQDVYELTFWFENDFEIIPWQFVTFMIDSIWARAYSVLEKNWKEVVFLIKKLELENGWRWWSKFLCELKKWEKIKWLGPSWHFTLQKNEKNKIFLWTGTWLVPLYYQIKSALKNWHKEKLKFIFGVRKENDIFYLDELNNLKNKYKNFDFEIYLSNENSKNYKNGYITEEIKNLNWDFKEAYLCGNPVMIDSAKNIFLENWFLQENIFDEKY